MTKRTRLFFKSISEIVGGNGIGVITLTDGGESRAITVVCDAAMKYQLGLRSVDWRQRAHLLPEALILVLSRLTNLGDFEMGINSLVDGEYKVTLLNTQTLDMCQLRLSDAVLLSRISDIPLYIDDELFNRQGAPYVGDSDRMAIPINTLSTERLKEELRRAVEREDYRFASVLKNEINNRPDSGADNDKNR